MQFITLAACFFLLCYGHHHHPRHPHVVRHYQSTPAVPAQSPPSKADPVDPILRPTKNCETISAAYDDFFYSAMNGFGSREDHNRDRFVARYPANEQRRVLLCLEKSGRGN